MDELTKGALKKGNIAMQTSISKAVVKCLIWRGGDNQMWQERSDREGTGRHLYQIKKSVNIFYYAQERINCVDKAEVRKRSL